MTNLPNGAIFCLQGMNTWCCFWAKCPLLRGQHWWHKCDWRPFSGGTVVWGVYAAGEHIRLFYSVKTFISAGYDSCDFYISLLGFGGKDVYMHVCVCVCVCVLLFKQLPAEEEPGTVRMDVQTWLSKWTRGIPGSSVLSPHWTLDVWQRFIGRLPEINLGKNMALLKATELWREWKFVPPVILERGQSWVKKKGFTGKPKTLGIKGDLHFLGFCRSKQKRCTQGPPVEEMWAVPLNMGQGLD